MKYCAFVLLLAATFANAQIINNGGVSSPVAGAVADEKRAFDGAMTSLVSFGSSTSPLTPSYTTNFASEQAVNVYAYLGNGAWTPPAGTSGTIVSVTPTASQYSVFAYSQNIASAGGTAGGLTATVASTPWIAITVPIIPNGTMTFRTAAVTQQGSGNTNTVTTTSSNVQSGDLVLACITFTNTSNAITPPTGGTTFAIYKQMQNGTITTNCYLTKATATPSSYVFGQSVGITTATTAFAVGITNALYPDEKLTSSSANFASGDVAKDFCVAGVGAQNGTVNTSGTQITWVASNNGMKFWQNMPNSPILINGTQFLISTYTNASVINASTTVGTNTGVPYVFPGNPQACGTIGQVLSSTTLVGYGVWDVGTTNNTMEYRYGTDNTSALQTAINNLTKGGTIYLPIGGMMILGTGQTATSITFPVSTWVPINIVGQGSGSARWEAGQVGSDNTQSFGSELIVANTALTGAALTNGTPGSPGNTPEASWHFSDFGIMGGAGNNFDGGGLGSGTHGLAPVGWANVLIQNVRISNFAGDGLNFTPPSGGFTGFVLVENSYFFQNGGAGTHFNATNAGFQNITFIDDTFDNNGLYGLQLGGATGTHWTLSLIGNNLSRNVTSQLQIDSGTTIQGCSIGTNYWEIDGNTNTAMVTNANLMPCWFTMPQQTVVYGGTGTFTGFLAGSVLTSSTGACASFTARTPSVLSGNLYGPQNETVQCTGTTGASTLVVGSLPTATNTWLCRGGDLTSHVECAQSGTSTTSCTLSCASVTTSDFLSVQLTPQ